MHWILQENLINPTTRDQVRQLLLARQVEHTLVRLIPFFHQVDGEMPAPAGPVFVYGSTGLGVVAKSQGWAPGYFDDNLDYELMLRQYGGLALNASAICATLQEMPRVADRFFVRPVLDNKSFAGTVMTWEEFEAFRRGVAQVANEQDATLSLTDRIVAAPLTDISAEYRCFVIGDKVVTASRYKTGELVAYSPDVPTEMTAFAQGCVDHWRPNDAFTIDVAVTRAGPKVIELNSANSAGFYACDVGAIIDAVNSRLD
jgi:hypothetical protein